MWSQGVARSSLFSCLLSFLCQEMLAKSMAGINEDMAEILSIQGMEMKHGQLFFNGEKVKSIRSADTGKDYNLGNKGIDDSEEMMDDYIDPDIATGDINEVMPIKDIKELT